MRQTMNILCISLLIFAAGCEKDSPSTTGTPAAAEAAPAATEPAEAGLPADGTKHDPPIELSEVPEGAWYCDMGTAHYTQKSEGDGKCPLCGMALHEKRPAKNHGHSHGDHAH